MSPVGSSTSTNNTAPGSSATTTAGATDVTKDMFLQLLVAQLQNQDPLNPADGTQFLTQLAQFQQLEQSMNTGQDITAMRQDLDKLVAGLAGGSTTPTS